MDLQRIPLASAGSLVIAVTLRDYLALLELAEARQAGLETARREAESANQVKSAFLASWTRPARSGE